MRQLLQPALCTAKTGGVASDKEQRDAMATGHAQLNPHAVSGACLPPSLLPGDEGEGGLELPPQLTATERQTSRMAQPGEAAARQTRPPGTEGETPGAQAQGQQAIPLFHGLPQHARVPLSHS